MDRQRMLLLVLFGVVFLLIIGSVQANNGHQVRRIVVFKSGVLNEPARQALVKKFGGVIVKDLTLIDSKAVLLPPGAEAGLSSQPGVLRIDDDVKVVALGKAQPAEVLPWGIDKIDAELAWPTTTGDPVKVAIVDTGIDLSHPDLQANIMGGYNAINPLKSAKDDNGHGTHVAGTIAAIDNTIGVVGVGPKIDLYSVKVLNAAGSGYLSDVIEGIGWAADHGIQVVNMSLGTSSDVQSLHDAVANAQAAGVTEVAAAGNSGGLVIYPAAYPEVIAVSATDQTNTIASWSSRGPEVDLAAPGVGIYSTYKGSTYKTLSGTSMATPHVAGTAALVLTTPVGAYDSNGNGRWDPVEVQNKLQATATDLGAASWDPLYGYGLVNAYQAITQ